MYLHSSVSLNNEKFVIKFVKINLRYGNFSDLNSACLKVFVPVKIFQLPDMRNEIEQYQDATNGLFVSSSLHFKL